jgi:uncharacterized protein
MAGYYTLKTTGAGKHMFNLHAGNHEVILTSESYEAKASALKGIESVRANGIHDERFERKATTANQPYFVLKAGNGEPIGHSEMYGSTGSMEGGIRSVIENAPSTTVKDMT